jgi:hypothetical protein
MSKDVPEAERKRAFRDVLFGSSKPTICHSCSYVILTRRGYENPCKKGHYDSGKDKEFCEDHPNPEYHSKKS